MPTPIESREAHTLTALLPLSSVKMAGHLAYTMLSRTSPRSLPVLVELCRAYDVASLWSIANVLKHEYDESVFKDWRTLSEVIEFTVITAPLLSSEHLIRIISADGVSIRKVVPSMLSAGYPDERFDDWGNAEATRHHVDSIRGALLDSTIFAPHFDSRSDKLWLGRNYTMVLPLLEHLRNRQSANPELILSLSGNASPSLIEGIL